MSITQALQFAGQQLAIHAVIRRWLEENSMTQADLARMIGIDRQFITQVLKNERDLPDMSIGSLPDGLRQQVAGIRARRHYAAGDEVLRRAGLPPRVRQATALHADAPAGALA